MGRWLQSAIPTLSSHPRRTRFASFWRRPARSDLREAGRARQKSWAGERSFVCGLGAAGRRRQCRRRLQRLGWATHQMRMLGGSGVWELFIPDLEPGALYKFEIRAPGGLPFLKADPYAVLMEVPPNTSSIVFQSNYKFRDPKWMKKRASREHFRQPLSIYEVHFGSWRRVTRRRQPSISVIARWPPLLADYVLRHGFHSCRVSAAERTSVWTIVGLSGQQLLRAFSALRHAGRSSLSDRLSASARHRRDHGLGAGAFSERRFCARPL